MGDPAVRTTFNRFSFYSLFISIGDNSQHASFLCRLIECVFEYYDAYMNDVREVFVTTVEFIND